MGSFRNRLMGLGSSQDPSTVLPLSPLATRLCDALESIAEDIPQVGMVSIALRKQMARNPIPDEDILTQLVWVQEMVHAIIVGPSLAGTDEQPETDYKLTDADIAILNTLSGPHGDDVIE